MRLLRFVTVAALAAGLWLGACSDDSDKPKQDSGIKVPDAKLTDGTADTKALVDAPIPDQNVSKKPEITAIIPSDGFADGGTLGYIPVVMTGKNFAAGASVFIDGGYKIIMNVTVSSPVSVAFQLPPNPYGDPVKKIFNPYRADIQIMSNGMMSEIVKFQYTNSKDMDSKLKGALVTASTAAFADFFSKPIEGKVFVDGVTDTTTGDSGKVKADVGYGPTGSDPSKDSGWRWFSTKFNKDDGTYDVYYGAIKVPLIKSYDVAFRFSTDLGKTFIYADTDDTDLTYTTAKAGTLTATKAPDGYCQNNADCITAGFKAICKVHATDDTKNVCVECLQETDCSGNAKALGPHCDSSTQMCYCSGDTECAKSQWGKKCLTPKYCGCAADTDCSGSAKCTQTPDGLQLCM